MSGSAHQWFLIALSVRPGRSLAIDAHLLPCTACARRMVRSSSSVKGSLHTSGLSWLHQLRAQQAVGRVSEPKPTQGSQSSERIAGPRRVCGRLNCAQLAADWPCRGGGRRRGAIEAAWARRRAANWVALWQKAAGFAARTEAPAPRRRRAARARTAGGSSCLTGRQSAAQLSSSCADHFAEPAFAAARPPAKPHAQGASTRQHAACWRGVCACARRALGRPRAGAISSVVSRTSQPRGRATRSARRGEKARERRQAAPTNAHAPRASTQPCGASCREPRRLLRGGCFALATAVRSRARFTATARLAADKAACDAHARSCSERDNRLGRNALVFRWP